MTPTLQIIQLTLQALSAFAIAGGLLYTAIQFREARKSQGVANFAKLVELQLHLRKIRVDQPEAPLSGRFEGTYRATVVETIGGGSSEVQKSIIARRLLGLPKNF